MKYLKICIICFFASVFVIFTSCPRYDIITHFNWKLIDDGDNVPGFLDLRLDTINTPYRWPVIVENGKCVGIVLFVFVNEIVLYSFDDNGIVRYMYI